MNLHLDLTNGASGETLLAALLDLAGDKRAEFRAELDKAGRRGEFEILLHDGYKKDVRCLTAVVLDKNRFSADAAPKMNYKEAMQIVLSGDVSDGAKLTAVKALECLSRAEGRTGDEQLLETGDLANVAVILAVAIALDLLRPERVTAGRVNLGSGLAIADGKPFEVPRPLVTRILEGAPVFSDACEGELTTPVGAALVKTIVNAFGVDAPTAEQVGRGGGERDFPERANVLTASLWEDRPAEPQKEPEQAAPAPVESGAAETVDKIMAAMEDLEQNFIRREKEVKPAEPQAQPEAKQEVKLTQSLLLEKLREIEAKLQTASKPRPVARQENNESLQKLARLEGLTKPAEPKPAEEPKPAPAPSLETGVADTGVLELTATVASASAEELEFLSELCLANNALDVFFEPVYVNGFRPAYKLSVTVAEKDLGLFSRLILRHSSAMGVRYTRLNRVTMETQQVEKPSPFGPVAFTRTEERGDEASFAEKKRIARESGKTLREIERILDSLEDGNEE